MLTELTRGVDQPDTPSADHTETMLCSSKLIKPPMPTVGLPCACHRRKPPPFSGRTEHGQPNRTVSVRLTPSGRRTTLIEPGGLTTRCTARHDKIAKSSSTVSQSFFVSMICGT